MAVARILGALISCLFAHHLIINFVNLVSDSF
jgi:hypothetical protein